jgi:hypothetical protein
MRATVCATREEIEDARSGPGAIFLLKDAPEGRRYLFFRCPCGCGAMGALAIRPQPDREGWELSDYPAHATLVPSVRRTLIEGGCGWRGFLTNGEWVNC